MRRYLACLLLLTFLLLVTMATAQQSSSSEPQQGTTTTTTTTTTQQNPSSSDQTRHQHSGMSHAKSSSSAGEQTVEGCIVKEEADFFLIPSHGNPIELQASSGQDFSEHAGHKVKVHGTESALSASGNMGIGATGGTAGTAASTTTTTASGAQSSTHSSVSEPADSSGSSQADAASGTGNNMHRLATKQMTVVKLDHIASSCPVNWNPNISSK